MTISVDKFLSKVIYLHLNEEEMTCISKFMQNFIIDEELEIPESLYSKIDTFIKDSKEDNLFEIEVDFFYNVTTSPLNLLILGCHLYTSNFINFIYLNRRIKNVAIPLDAKENFFELENIDDLLWEIKQNQDFFVDLEQYESEFCKHSLNFIAQYKSSAEKIWH